MQKIIAIVIVALLAFTATQAAESLQQFVNDNHVLNYALTLENLEAALYAQGLAKFNSDNNYTMAGFPAGSYKTLQFLGGQESAHAQSLNTVLGARQWPAVPVCTYNFTNALASVTSFVNTLYTVENLGSTAYDGASSYITNSFILGVAAGIATIEARHTALLAVIVNPSSVGNASTAPFPDVREQANSPSVVYSAVLANGFIVNCPSTQNVPVPYYPGGWSSGSGNLSSFPLQPAINFKNSSLTTGPTVFYSATGAGPAIQASDLMVLQYALTLENLEAFFYVNFSAAYTPQAIQLAYPNVSATAASLLSSSIATISSHETAHVSFLQTVINNHNATPNTPCSYNFTSLGLPYGSTNFTQFLYAAYQLENTGVSAYIGAISFIANPTVAQVAATIATVEARHASFIADVYFNAGNIYGSNVNTGVTGNVTFNDPDLNLATSPPLNNDNGLTPSQVYTAITSTLGLITSCPSTNKGYYGQPTAATYADFFGDNGATLSPLSQLAGFVVPTTTAAPSTTATTNQNGSSSKSLSTTSSTGSTSSTVTAAFAMIAMLVFFF